MSLWHALGIHDYGAFVLGTVLVVLLPGPNSLYAFVTASRQGPAAGFRAALGILTGDAILMSAAVLGAASLLRYLPTLFALLQFAGAAYLAWMGGKLVWEAVRHGWGKQTATANEDDRAAAPEPEPRRVAIHPFRRALVISLLNPKAILFFFSFFVLFVDADAPHPYWAFVLLGATLQGISATYLTVLILVGARLHRWSQTRPRVQAWGLAATGSAFLLFSAKLVRDAFARVGG